MVSRSDKPRRISLITDRRFMDLALELARKGQHRVRPNPLVGCVIVKDGAVVGAGYHEYFGGPHAEVNALVGAGKDVRGATMYVTLEPCNHWGKTPPCTDAIKAAGIKRVVTAMEDPNPRVSGKGIQRLRDEGIAVTVGVRRSDARVLNRAYIRRFTHQRVVRVTVKAAMSLDGKIATKTGESKWITGPAARDYVHGLRSTYDAIIVGVRTVIRDNPLLTSHGKGMNPVRVIIDPELRIPLNSRVLNDDAPKIVLHGDGAPAARQRRLKSTKAVLLSLPCRKGKIDFRTVVKKLADLDIHRIFVEGGGETIAGALESGTVNDVLFFIAPKIIGGRNAITPVEGSGSAWMDTAMPVRGWNMRRIGGDILITGNVERKCSRVSLKK